MEIRREFRQPRHAGVRWKYLQARTQQVPTSTRAAVIAGRVAVIALLASVDNSVSAISCFSPFDAAKRKKYAQTYATYITY